ncbi:MAG: glycogen/starch/alpha-glucan family phosphorylase [Chlamydiales bacterium]|nr:glycogen/starch/alpha-glucan family phosphorylase [Chlamydiales bacterium]
MNDVENVVDKIIAKIKHYTVVAQGRTADEATLTEFYRAFVWSLREEVMANWAATEHAFAREKVRKLYYFSLEYMPGRQFSNNITNISAWDIVKSVLARMNRPLEDVIKIENDIGIGNGGLGRLASCLMDSLATKQYPAMGYGLRYQYGIFEQEIWCGVQIERPDCWLITDNPWELRRDRYAANIDFGGRIHDKQNEKGELVHILTDYDAVRAIPFDYPIIGYQPSSDFTVLTLRLWSTKESPRNFALQSYNLGELGQATENTSLTDVLYPNDNNDMGKRVRLKQEFLLVSASLQNIIHQHHEVFGNMDDFGDKVRIQINDTHPALIVAELMRTLCANHKMSWDKALETTRCICSYTNHTIMKEALEEWNECRVKDLLPRQYYIIQKLNDQFCTEVRNRFPTDEERVRRMSMIEDGQIKMAHLAIYGSHKVNGVAKLHSELLKTTIFKDFYELWPEKFTNVTNGVTQRRWLMLANPSLSQFITERIGFDWATDFTQIKKLADFASDEKSRNAFLEIKKNNKQRLLALLCEQIERHRDSTQHQCNILPSFDALFDVQIKRVHEYKRQIMNALHALMVYRELKENPNARSVPRLILIGGKAAPGYEIAKNTIRLIYCIGRKINQDEQTGHKLKIFFLENYNVSNAEIIIPAADLSEQISMAGMEASGTGNMKLAMNGALTIGTEDGANIEMHEAVTDQWWPFSFGASAAENVQLKHHPRGVYEKEPKIKQAMDMLTDGSLAENEAEDQIFKGLFQQLLSIDRYHVLNDLMPYYETQKKVEELFSQPQKWAEYAIHNIASMGTFSSDESIKNYAEKLWGLSPCPPAPEEIKRIREQSKLMC